MVACTCPENRLLRIQMHALRTGLSHRRYHKIASGGKDKKLLLSSFDGSEPLTFAGHIGSILDIEFSSDQLRLISAGTDDIIRIWDVADPKKKPEMLAGHSDPVVDIELSPDGRLLASASYDDTVRLWEVPGYREGTSFKRRFGGYLLFSSLYTPCTGGQETLCDLLASRLRHRQQAVPGGLSAPRAWRDL